MGLWKYGLNFLSIIERCPPLLSVIRRFFYKGFVLNCSDLLFFVCYLEVSVIRDVSYLEVSLYFKRVKLHQGNPA